MKFETIPLKELLGEKGYIRGPFGSALKRDELKQTGIPVYEQQHAIYGTREFRFYIGDEKYRELQRFTVKENDLIISCSGTVGRITIIEKDDPKGIISQALLILRPDSQKVLPEYLYYFFSSEKGFYELISASHGAVQQNIAPRSVVEKILIPYTNIDQQKAIVGVLKSLDKKISLNQKTNETLEQIAQAIFKSWFVNFDPVKAKAAGRSPEGMDEATANLFPDDFEESEMGMIPKGWGTQRIDNILELAYGKALKSSDRIDGDVPVYGSGGINGYHNISLSNGPGIIVGRKGTVGSLYWENKEFFAIDTVFYVLVKNKYSLEFVYYLLQTLSLETMNTDAAVPGLNRNNVYRLLVTQFPQELIIVFTKIVKSIKSQSKNNIEKTKSLTLVRDALLPKLLSGDITISEDGVQGVV